MMGNNRLFGLFALFLSLILVTLFSASVYAHNSKAYSHDSERKTMHPDWMSLLRDTKKLNEVSIIGTHDSMALYGGVLAQTQSMKLIDQLNSGIRALDIRVRLTGDDKLAIHHGPIYQHASFGDVLNTVSGFLKHHPKEFILMRLSRDGGDSFGNQVVEGYIDKYPNYFWVNSKNDDNPLINSLRGKIVLMPKEINIPTPSAGGKYGIAYPSGEDVQDNYQVDGSYDNGLYDKWKHVKRMLNKSTKAETKGIILNYLSATGVGKGNGSSPFFLASGHSDSRTDAPRLTTGHTNAEKWYVKSHPDFPELDCMGKWCSIFNEGTNDLTYKRVGKEFWRTGVLMVDFPGPGLIDKVILTNGGLIDLGYDGTQHFADVDADGKADFCRKVGNKGGYKYRCSLAKGNGSDKKASFGGNDGNATIWFTGDLGYDGTQHFADVNGDGKSDFCRKVGDKGSYKFTCNTGKAGEIWFAGDLGYDGTQHFPDVDGNKKADFCRKVGKKGSYKFTCYLTGVGGELWFAGDLGYDGTQHFADVNGDGKSDFCRKVGDRGSYKFFCYIEGSEQKIWFAGDLGYDGTQHFADVNGDGKSDFCRKVGNKGSYKFTCYLTGVGGELWFAGDLGYDGTQHFSDVDGDKKADFIRIVGNPPHRSITIWMSTLGRDVSYVNW